ncbi:MAG: hypothetical protein GWO24_31170, partial [Akkermansiaceae bacterium]|nr:hypothetical protein [Akkermansiaceae bacterium]
GVEALDAVERLFSNLEKARRSGLDITAHILRLVVAEQGGDGLGGNLETLCGRRLLGSA